MLPELRHGRLVDLHDLRVSCAAGVDTVDVLWRVLVCNSGMYAPETELHADYVIIRRLGHSGK